VLPAPLQLAVVGVEQRVGCAERRVVADEGQVGVADLQQLGFSHAGNGCAHLLHVAGAEGAFGQSARVLRGGYAQLPADHADQTGSDLLVARHSRDIVLWPTPFGVLGAAHLATAV